MKNAFKIYYIILEKLKIKLIYKLTKKLYKKKLIV